MVDEPGGDYWKHWQHYIRDVLLARKLISPADLALYKVTDSVDEAVAEMLDFYRVYHSMRYVHGDLVLRLQQPLPEALLERIRTRVRRHRAWRHLRADATRCRRRRTTPHLADLPRLRFRFDRRSLGRLRHADRRDQPRGVRRRFKAA